jgi:hypothetical protein
LLCRTHLAHRSKGVQGVHEAESSRMLRFRVTARRKKPSGWDRQGAWGGRRTSAATRTGDREAGWAWGGNQDRRQGGRVAGRAWDSREGVGQHGGQTPATRGTACGGSGGALAKVQHADTAQRAVCSGTAPMSRVHDKADERVHGTWVGRSLELR